MHCERIAVLQQYLKEMWTFAYKENDSRMQWKEKSEGYLESTLDKDTFFASMPHFTTEAVLHPIRNCG